MEERQRFLPPGWYPESDAGCREEIENYAEYLKNKKIDVKNAKGGIVPHAGWFFSGRLAALVLKTCADQGAPDVAAIFGGHLGPGKGIVYNDKAWATPLGPLEIDAEITGALMDRMALRTEGAHTNDNTVEVQIPLVKYYFPNSRIVAVRAPHSPTAIEIGRIVAELAQAQGKSLVAIGSTDLTHYGPNYDFSPQGSGPKAVEWVRKINDKGFIDKALAMDFNGMLEHAAVNRSACSAGGAAAAASACQVMGSTQGILADYYTSNDLMPGSSFVGYAGIVY